MTLTDKQKDIIKTINLGHERGHLLDLDELLEVLPYSLPSTNVTPFTTTFTSGFTGRPPV